MVAFSSDAELLRAKVCRETFPFESIWRLTETLADILASSSCKGMLLNANGLCQ